MAVLGNNRQNDGTLYAVYNKFNGNDPSIGIYMDYQGPQGAARATMRPGGGQKSA